MKKIFVAMATVALAIGCNDIDDTASVEKLVVTGYSCEDTRTAFDTPNQSSIPFLWSDGDYIWLGSTKSDAISEGCKIANFTFYNGLPAYSGVGHVFYNMTGNSEAANVLAEQTADGNLGNDGDFGYATLDNYNAFFLKHKTAYVWFDTTTDDSDMPKLNSITLSAPEGVNIAGVRTYDFKNDEWDDNVTNGSNTIKINFEGGYALQSSNNGVMAVMVCLPAAIAGQELTITYAFEGGKKFTEVKTPSSDFVAGATQRVKSKIAKSALVEPELDYELRVLTFEDEDKQFNAYELEYGDWWTIEKWSDLIPEMQYGDPKTYGDGGYGGGDARYTWWDEGNTDIKHTFTNAWDMDYYCYWSGGHIISNYTKPNYTNDDLRPYVEEYYENTGADVDAILEYAGWQMLQLMTPIGAHSGENFAVHYGYQDEKSQGMSDRLTGFEFDGEPRVIDHMWVTLTNYTLNQLVYGVWQPGVSQPGQGGFGGNYVGLTTDSNLKIVAYGYCSKDYGFGASDQGEDYCDSKSEFYLVKDGVPLTEWAKWDLSELGEVAHVNFNFEYSDDMGGREGFTIPAYFAYDDVAVRVKK